VPSSIAHSEQTGQYGFTYGYDCLADAENDEVRPARPFRMLLPEVAPQTQGGSV
jgi:hypothetical protein